MAMTSADTAQTPHPLLHDPCCARSINKQKYVIALSIDNLSRIVNDTVIASMEPSHVGGRELPLLHRHHQVLIYSRSKITGLYALSESAPALATVWTATGL